MSSLCMWLIRLKILKSFLTSFFHNPHPIYEPIFLALSLRYTLYTLYLTICTSLTWSSIISHLGWLLLWPPNWSLYTHFFQSHQFSSLFSPQLSLLLLPDLPDLTFPYSSFFSYYPLIALVFLLLLSHAKHIPTSSPTQLQCPQPRTFSPGM